MRSKLKLASEVSLADYRKWPIWEFRTNNSPDETAVRPVRKLPTNHLDGRFIGLKVRLANGSLVWATLNGVDVSSEKRTRHFLDASFYRGNESFHLARYFDVFRARRGPEALAKFFGLTVDEVFPVEYDLTAYVAGDEKVLRGKIVKEPTEQLTRQELIKLSLSQHRSGAEQP